MPRRATVFATVALLVAVSLAGCFGGGAGTPTPNGATPAGTETAASTATQTPVTPGDSYRTATVDLVDRNGTQLATVDVWIADSFTKRYTGLSDTTALEPGQGMLFVHDQEGNHAYVMRDMAFPLDMVFIAENGTITTIHHAPLPPEGAGGNDLTRYSGRAKYVLEVPMGYTNETRIDEGDRVRVGDI
ncbi:DUF192 domain-containing protein [Haloplanus halobius]|uniref:DUF192 domain-containing protein n=1 Tax=Haloplanus halobius TaxID=2934938 RepID=UPI00200E7A29|nr:DUF192 domain-containing protein [Haloplanus sp. XH21]